jgi:hypothetical protein
MAFNITRNVRIKRDQQGRAQLIHHIQEPYKQAAGVLPTPGNLASAYMQDVAEIYAIPKQALTTLQEPVSRKIKDEETRLRFLEQKRIVNATVIGYQQTYLGLPVWEAIVTVRLHEDPLRVTSSVSAIHHDVKVKKPLSRAKYMPGRPAVTALLRALVEQAKGKLVKISDARLLIYRYDPAARLDPEAGEERPKGVLQGRIPTLPVKPVPRTIRSGQHYVVTEALFTTALGPWSALNWRTMIEVESGAVLYLRAFVTSAFGNVFSLDPVTSTGDTTITPCSSAATLDPLSTIVTLQGLTPPAPGDPQALEGGYVKLGELSTPTIAAPTAALPAGNFSFSAVTDNFAAVNTYYHCDLLFRTMVSMGFDLAAYFPDTTFPLTVDHRDDSLGTVNARGYGNAAGNGAGGMGFNLAQVGCPVGIAADYRVVLHEFSHELLWEHVNSPNFGFSHSAGDSLAAILMDPQTKAPDRFATFPWISILTVRRHDRDVAAGWAWGGTHDDTSYSSEQILSTTLFRVYRSTCGDSWEADKRRMAARYVAYLIVKGIGLLTATTTDPEVYANALMDADLDTSEFEGIAGGAVHKVVRWSFEKQGLYQPAGAPSPVTSPGDPPEVDVYIDDGRAGEYQFQEDFWNTTAIWNRLTPAGGTEADHETPIVGVTNYLYVRIKNRGTQAANNVVVRTYHCVPATGLVWPDDWQATTTAEITMPGSIAAGGDAIVGPFEWIPEAIGHECLLAAVSADGDLSNIDPATSSPAAAGPSPHWRLVPFDNNLAQRNVAPVPGGGGGLNLSAAFRGRRFKARNPYKRPATMRLEAVLPDFLVKRGWRLLFENPGGSSFSLGPRGEREIVLGLHPGQDFSEADVGGGAAIEVRARIDGMTIGGLTYSIDPRMKTPAVERPKAAARPDCTALAKELVECLRLSADDVKSVRIKSILVQIDLKEDC